ncbi:hypothetical protein ASPWEDRAFT_24862 [Aspergillus wentii DTO 134E9]|uniref:Single-strand DNA deaminase toxin A-like C-terminal domain-containing protein n=1 Tax=Aspergillus wentii DTO 134E9 TaxID=1073089 RepID=A0A1L9RVP8_ASPWE|nr:uncharacterized protein ASPWEDRAFT_24862 [Aspergillus wentii DTO 134E9]KAI9928886.1 hypothetical protein MW887_002109 [Aspergillus wentii]OJJ38992.1 hypothetical protein ASPWEDRAFT_24862 [Aspergillus wentii DTO 134E9]
MNNNPEADVLWWDAHSYYVLCPYCEGVHRHGMNWDGPQSRVSHCENAESYICCFPINDQGQVAYEIDKKEGRYVNICAAGGAGTDEIDLLSQGFSRMVSISREEAEIGVTDPNIYDDSNEMITIDLKDGSKPLEQKRIVFAISACASGRTAAVREYLESSVEPQIFIHGRKPDGDITLIMAAAEASPTMVSLLLDHGAQVNTVNRNGRSALMEAALWGRLGNVKLLLEHGADENLRDEKNWLAIDLARPTHRNRRERYERAGGDLSPTSNQEPAYREDNFKRDIDRQSIVRLLGGEDRKSNIVYGSPLTVSRCEEYSFKRSPMKNSIMLQGPIANYPITGPRKTIARLERGGQFASVAAMSGWSHDLLQLVRVSGRQWTREVFYLSRIVGHNLACDDFDQGIPGQYHACHAEKQLIAYFVDRHVFLPRDTVSDPELEAEIEWVEDQLDTGPETEELTALERQLDTLNHRKERHTALIDMSNARPPVSLTEAVILISSPVCEDCMEFENKVNQVLGLSIQLFAAC